LRTAFNPRIGCKKRHLRGVRFEKRLRPVEQRVTVQPEFNATAQLSIPLPGPPAFPQPGKAVSGDDKAAASLECVADAGFSSIVSARVLIIL
jgi:hypothetical protein